MQVKVEDKGKCRREVEIEVPVETIKEEYDSIVKYFRQHVALPGFRKGKAPEAMVRTKFSKDIQKELHDKVVPKSFHQALDENKLEVEHILNIDEGEFDPEQPFKFTILLDVKPEVNLPEYKGVSVTKEAAEVKDENIDAAIDNVRQQMAKYEDITDGRAVSAGDLVQVNFEGKVGDKPVKDFSDTAAGIGEGEDFWVRADENAFIPEFAEGLLGVASGDTAVFDVNFPEDFSVEELRGTTASYSVDVLAIRERILPEVDEEFCKRMGVDNAEALREEVSKDLQSQLDNSLKNKMMSEIQEWLLSNITVEIPESTLQQETQNNIQDIVRKSTSDGESEDSIKEHKDEIFNNAQEAATKTLQMRYILGAIAAKEEIDATGKEMKEEIARISQMYGVDEAVIRERIAENGSDDMVKADVVARKTMDFLFDNADVKG